MKKNKNIHKKNKASDNINIKEKNEKTNVNTIEILYNKSPNSMACRISKGNLTFVIIHWYRKIINEYLEGGFYYKSPLQSGWEKVSLVPWMDKYMTAEDFLIDYPQFIKLFRSKDK